jgi:hypothetical protein
MYTIKKCLWISFARTKNNRYRVYNEILNSLKLTEIRGWNNHVSVLLIPVAQLDLRVSNKYLTHN